MTKRSDKKKYVRHWLRRIFRVLFWITGIFLCLFIAAIIFIRIQYPEPRVLQLISEQVESSTGMSLEIRDVAWHLPLRLDASQIALNYPDRYTKTVIPLFTLERFSVSFRLLPLLKRQVDVQSVILDKPRMYLDSDQWIVPHATSKADSAPSVKREAYTSPAKALPFSLGLSRLSMKEFDCTVILPHSHRHRSIQITGLNFNLNHLRIPRETTVSLENVRGRIHLFTNRSRIKYSEDGFDITLEPDIDMRAAWSKNQQWRVRGRMGLAAQADTSHRIDLRMEVIGTGKGDSIHVETVQMDLDGSRLFRLYGGASQLVTYPEFNATLESESINLSRIFYMTEDFMPPSIQRVFDPWEIQGDIKLPEGNIRGNTEGMHIQIHTALQNGSVSCSDRVLDSLFYQLNIDGYLKAVTHKNKSFKFTDGQIQGAAGMSAFHLALNDSVGMQAGPLFLEFISSMDASGLPCRGRLTGRLDSLFKGQVGFDFNWGLNPESQGKPESVRVNGFVFADSMDLMELPNWPNTAQGMMNLNVDLAMPNLYQAVLNIRAELNGLGFTLENQTGIWPAMNLRSEWIIQTEPAFRQVWLDSGHVRVNDFLNSQFTGQADLKHRAFWIELQKLTVDLGKVQSILPPLLQESMESLTFGGQTMMSASVSGEATQPDSVQVRGTISLEDGMFCHGNQELKVSGIQGKVTVEGVPEVLNGNIDLSFGKLDLGARRSQPIEGSLFQFDWQWIADESVSMSEALLRNDSLGIEAQFEGSLAGLASRPALYTVGNIQFQRDDWVETVQEMRIRGKSAIKFQIEQKDSSQYMVISGSAAMRPLEMKQRDMLSMNDIHGRVPFQIALDLEKGVIMTDPDYSPPSWIDYESRRSQYRSLNPDQGALYAKVIQVSRYQFTDLAMDIDIRKGYIQVPWFMVDLFNGNVGGYLQIFLGTGQPEDIAYEIHAQAARINAAALGDIPIEKEEEAELDVTMAFSGLGMDIEKDMEINGYFYMTQIGPKFASRMLQGLDPNGEDRNIRLTRRLLNMGWKPKLFSFEMQHGYVYPSLSLSQPWFSPIRLPETLSYGRLPLKFFLENPGLAQAK
ncbi:AsmA family protein [bacterium]|nr:AsmA family protein [bacterium]